MYYCKYCGKAFEEDWENCPNCDSEDSLFHCSNADEDALVQCEECGEWFMPDDEYDICKDCKSKKNHIKGKTVYCDFSNIQRIRKEERERELKQVAQMLARVSNKE